MIILINEDQLSLLCLWRGYRSRRPSATQLVQEPQLDTVSRSGHATIGKYLFSEEIHCGLTQPEHCEQGGGAPRQMYKSLELMVCNCEDEVRMNGDINVRKVGYRCHTEW